MKSQSFNLKPTLALLAMLGLSVLLPAHLWQHGRADVRWGMPASGGDAEAQAFEAGGLTCAGVHGHLHSEPMPGGPGGPGVPGERGRHSSADCSLCVLLLATAALALLVLLALGWSASGLSVVWKLASAPACRGRAAFHGRAPPTVCC